MMKTIFFCLSFIISLNSLLAQSWHVLDLDTSASVLNIEVLSKDTLIVSVGEEQVSRSYDGGISWQKKTTPGSHNSLSFSSSDKGFISLPSSSAIFSTEDAGNTWDTSFFYTYSTITGPAQFSHVEVWSNGRGWALGGTTLEMETFDGGDTWNLVSGIAPVAGYWWNGIESDRESNVILWANDRIKYQLDNTELWELSIFDFNFDCFLYNWTTGEGHIYDIEEGQISHYESNNLADWSQVSPILDTSTIIHDAVFYNQEIAYMTTNHQGMLLFSVDGGRVWQKEDVSDFVDTNQLFEIEIQDHHLFITAENGLVLTREIPHYSSNETISLCPHDTLKLMIEGKDNAKVIDQYGNEYEAEEELLFFPEEETTYQLWQNGIKYDEILVKISPKENCPVELFIAELVTLNNDNKNDTWQIQNLNKLQDSYQIRIYDIWGIEVFESTAYENNWPTKNGVAGEYVYTIEIDSKLRYSGTIRVKD